MKLYLKAQISEKKTIISFSSNDFIMKKKQFAISPLFETLSYETYHTVSKGILEWNHEIFMVVLTTKLEQNKFD